jgi:hypothetical protein
MIDNLNSSRYILDEVIKKQMLFKFSKTLLHFHLPFNNDLEIQSCQKQHLSIYF